MDNHPDVNAAAPAPAPAPDSPPATLTEREQHWSRMAYNTLTSEYLDANADLAQSMDGAVATRRHYRRYEIVQEQTTAIEVASNGDRIACRKGCSFCCHNRVVAPAHEVLTLADRIQQMPETDRRRIADRVARNAEQIEPLEGTQPFQTPVRCALLDDEGACSVYDDRPSTCRRYHSLSVQQCEASFFEPANLGSRIRLSTPLLVASAAQGMGFRKVLTEHGIDTTDYELNTALREALANPQACAERLLRGDKAFVHATVYGDALPSK